MIRSLIDTYANLGWLPDCRMSLNKGYTQGGSNADVVLVDGFIKGLSTGIDVSNDSPRASCSFHSNLGNMGY